MKKIISIALILCCFSLVKAQEAHNEHTGFRIGLTASPIVTWAKADGDLVENDGIKLGFQFGIIGDYHFKPNYAFSSGIYATYLSSSLKYFPDSSINYSHNYNVQSISVPLTIKLKTNEIGYITYYGQLGFTPSIRYRSRGDLKPDFNGAELTDENLIDRVAIANIALTAGGGIEYSIAGKTAILAGVEYNNGFLNQYKDDQVAELKEDKIFVNYLTLRLGVMF